MLLHDIGNSPNSTFKRINQHLKTNYGFTISENASKQSLVTLMEQLENEITELKVMGDDARSSSEITKRLLVLEGVKTLHEHGILHMDVPSKSPDEDGVISTMIDRVVREFKLSGNFLDSIKDAMNWYRSSEYRFLSDEDIEQQVYTGALARLRETLPHNNDMSTMMESEVSDAASEDSEMSGIEEDIDDEDDNKDPWETQAEKRYQGTVATEGNKMKESSMIKNLRKLLETEVSQAEVMMAAKGFAEELQEMVEKIGRLQNEDLPPVTDQMRETYGMDSASAFQTQIYGALQGVMDSLYTAKQQVDDAVSNMAKTGRVTAQTDMDMPVSNMEPPVDTNNDSADDDLDNISAELDDVSDEQSDEFGGEESLGRSKKMESILHKQVMEMTALVAKAHALKEAQRVSEVARVRNPYTNGTKMDNQQDRDDAAAYAKRERTINRNSGQYDTDDVNRRGAKSGTDTTSGSKPAVKTSSYGKLTSPLARPAGQGKQV